MNTPVISSLRPPKVLSPVVLAAGLAIALLIVGEIVSPGFAGHGQIVNMLRVSAFLGIIAIGQTIVIISGGEGIDLSVGKVATFAAIIGSRVMDGDNTKLLPALTLALTVAAAIGLCNGLGITYLRIPPFVMTLGMIGVVQGLILAYTSGQAHGRAAPFLTSLVNGKVIFDLPGLLFLWLLLAVAVTWMLRRTTYGWQLFAVGANRVSARLSGIPVRRTVILAYVLSSVFAGLAGILLLGYTESVFLDLADQYMLPSIAAAVIGGTLLAGGIGGYAGTAIGAVVLTVLQSLLITLEISAAGRTVINGLVLIVLLSLYGRQRRLRT
ncbi:ABC transporter permease [Phytoactinopolyspora limicola]|uniref:ABC transporter permease n=1 Tax=Phytoactinopolyspora limicola TaxID=2715536 RepID=UPI00140CA683|nr:ABC transporter permease [Phytoactinopolyspora limicola]